jgi:hypothetical protein
VGQPEALELANLAADTLQQVVHMVLACLASNGRVKWTEMMSCRPPALVVVAR